MDTPCGFPAEAGGSRPESVNYGVRRLIDAKCPRVQQGKPMMIAQGARLRASCERALPYLRAASVVQVSTTESGLSEIETMPSSASQAAKSGWSLGPWPQMPMYL